jgi:hypothetical protein
MRISGMNHSYRTDRPSRRVVLISGTFLLSFGMTLASPLLLSGCGDDKVQMGNVEKSDDPKEKAKDSMDYYKQQNLKGGKAKTSSNSNQGR